MQFKTICVIGLGYIGLPTAATFVNAGMRVIGVDTNPRIIAQLQNGDVHIYEPGLGSLVKEALDTNNLVISAKPEAADAYIIAVPTPFDEGKKADLSFVKSAAESIVPCLKRGSLVVLESTSPPLTTAEVLRPILEKSGLKAGQDFYLAYSPERVLPGQIIRELVENARVIGGIDPASAQAGKALYETFVKGQIITTTATTAEMVKLMENTSRDINIAIANEFARLADRFGVDVWEAIQIANLHPRINILQPGPGVGGHCISVDPWFLVEAAPDITALIHTARLVNDGQPNFVVNKVSHLLGGLEGKKIAALGLAYKPDIDDLRESPAIEVVEKLSQAGARVTAFEPFKQDFPLKHGRMAQSLEEAVRDADLLLLLVRHTQFARLEPTEIAQQTRARVVFDAAGGWDQSAWKHAGFNAYRLGVGER